MFEISDDFCRVWSLGSAFAVGAGFLITITSVTSWISSMRFLVSILNLNVLLHINMEQNKL
jgi:hypothetical protein